MTWAPGVPWWPRPSTPCWQGRRARWWGCSQLGSWTTWRTWRRSLGGNSSRHFKIWRRWRLLLDCGDGGIVSLGFCSLVCSCRWDKGWSCEVRLNPRWSGVDKCDWGRRRGGGEPRSFPARPSCHFQAARLQGAQAQRPQQDWYPAALERTAMILFRQDCAAWRLKFTRYFYCNVFVGLSSIIQYDVNHRNEKMQDA